MPDIFISYSRSDQSVAHELADAGLIKVEREETGRSRRNRFTFLWRESFDHPTRMSCSKDVGNTTDMSGSEPPDDTTDLSGSDGDYRTNLPRLPDIFGSDHTTDASGTYKEVRRFNKTVEEEGERARCKASFAPVDSTGTKPLARSQPSNESEDPEKQNPDASHAEIIRQVLDENGIKIRDGLHPAQMVELARDASCTTDLLVAFIGSKIREKAKRGDAMETSVFALKCVREDLRAWTNRPAGRAAASTIEAASRPRAEPECGACGGTGISRGESHWCYCETGQARRESDEPVPIKGSRCSCGSTLKYFLKTMADVVQCLFCDPPSRRGSRPVSDAESTLWLATVGAEGKIPRCRKCANSGTIESKLYDLDVTVEYCTCGWSNVRKVELGADWPAAETAKLRAENLEIANQWKSIVREKTA